MSISKFWAKFWKENWKAFRWLVVSIFIVRMLEPRLPFLETVDRSFLDLIATLHLRSLPSEIYVVEITNRSYKELFEIGRASCRERVLMPV